MHRLIVLDLANTQKLEKQALGSIGTIRSIVLVDHLKIQISHLYEISIRRPALGPREYMHCYHICSMFNWTKDEYFFLQLN